MATMTCSKCGIGNLEYSICSDCVRLEMRQETIRDIERKINRKERNWREQDVRRERKRDFERNLLNNQERIEQDRIDATLRRQAAYREREQERQNAIRREATLLRARADELERDL